ncbi:MAG: phage major capsid protein, P2 family [Brevundimonas sp.]|uniref:phage major capsid protein, P2 family n=1 Tax=Brevundimonas sp. TaxID=1871086 RepID=UPI000DBBC7D8|nr:phage major capsid protein, P2 family [Brevundimonas sp.]PZU62237.1 MAG: phage major capsid protein, P2 family [Brevundimonas sp.]
MDNNTLLAFRDYLEHQAELNGADVAAVQGGALFSIAHESFAEGEPSVQQRLIDKQQEDSAFLSRINIVPVPEIKGEKLGLGVSGTIASRTATTPNGNIKRKTTDISGVDVDGYECRQTDFDTHLTYPKLDMWAKFPDFETRISQQILTRKVLDQIMIGWNGASAAETTDRVANPLLQDVNIGWLQKYRLANAAAGARQRILSEGETEAGKIIIDPTGAGDYRNVNALVVDAIFNLMPSWARGDGELVVILGDQLHHDIFFPLVDNDNKPTEVNAADLILSAKRVGGKAAATVPYFPSDAIFVTRLDNLSIYEQEGKNRRRVYDDPSFNCVRTFESTNQAYVVEDYDFGCVIENIQFGPTEDEGG